jgi:iron complex outermembrane receptor protein
VDNLTDQKHVGSVIVNDGNGRFFEPGAGRKLMLGLEAQRRF